MIVLAIEALGVLIYMCLMRFSVLKNRGTKVKVAFLLLIGLIIFVRAYKYSTGMGLDLDEAEGGYNAWALANYGVDDHLASWPVYLSAWGSGMNILYPLITVPFIKILGLSVAVYRLPLLVISILAILLFFYTLIKIGEKDTTVLIVMMVVFLGPVMIEYSRWSVESNLFPWLMVIFVSLLLLFINQFKNNNQKWAIIDWTLFNITVGISAYAYSNMWIFLATFMVLIYACLIWKLKKEAIKLVALSVIILLVIVWPLALFLYVNYVSHKEIILFGNITVTKLVANRSSSQFVIGHGNDLLAIKNNLIDTFRVLITGYDGMAKNALPVVGAFYPFMLTFSLIGFGYSVVRRSKMDMVFLISVVACLPGICIILPNYTHLSAFMLPVLYLEAVGVCYVCKNRYAKIAFSIIFILALSVYMHIYFNARYYDLHNTAQETPIELKDAIKKADSLNRETVIVSSFGKAMYVVPRFYLPISPAKFNKVKSNEIPAEHTYYSYYGKWHFNDRLDSSLDKSKVYIVSDAIGANSQLTNMNHKRYGTFTVYWKN